MLCFEFEYLLPINPYGQGISSRKGRVGENCFSSGAKFKIFRKQRLSVLFSQFAYGRDVDNSLFEKPFKKAAIIFHFVGTLKRGSQVSFGIEINYRIQLVLVANGLYFTFRVQIRYIFYLISYEANLGLWTLV